MTRGRIELAPSVMCADFLHLADTLRIFEAHRIEYLHVDIMDGHYVPNFTLGTRFCRVLGEGTEIPLDIHLMIENVDQYLPEFCARRGSMVSFHPEVVWHPLRTLQAIRAFGCRAGLSIDPAMTLDTVKPLLHETDFLCMMTVNPGYAGQPLVAGGLERIAEFRDFLDRNYPHIRLEVDGNVSWRNIPLMMERGAEILVCGSSSLFDPAHPLAENIVRIREIAAAPTPGADFSPEVTRRQRSGGVRSRCRSGADRVPGR